MDIFFHFCVSKGYGEEKVKFSFVKRVKSGVKNSGVSKGRGFFAKKSV